MNMVLYVQAAHWCQRPLGHHDASFAHREDVDRPGAGCRAVFVTRLPGQSAPPAPAQAPDPQKVMTPDDELYRRSILARSRNYLLSYALRDQEWVLWLDVDIVWVRLSAVFSTVRCFY